MLHPDFPIRTDRLELRPFESGDLAAYLDLFSRPDVVRYLYWRELDEAAARDLLQTAIASRSLEQQGEALNLAVVLPKAGRLIGSVVLKWLSEQHRQGEIGFTLHPDCQGQGYATEAAQAVLALGFDDLGLHRICGHCDARNDSSARLMERLGMRQEAHLINNECFKGAWGDELVYAMLDSEWKRKLRLRR